MKNRLLFMMCLVATMLTTFTVALPAVYANPGTGVPFQTLQGQLDGIADAISGNDKLITVDCTAGTITDALREAPPGGRLIITVEGNCVENVTITRDDVTLQGGSGVVDGQITIDGARRVVINDLKVTGALHGILAVNNATVTVQNSIIEQNILSGIVARYGAFALIQDNTIEYNGECGILVSDSGHVNMLNNTIVSNFGDVNICSAVAAYRDARIRMLGGNEVTQEDLAGYALDIEHGSTFRQQNGHDTIVGRVIVFNTSNADFRDVAITGTAPAPGAPFGSPFLAIGADLNSVLRLRYQGGVPGNVTVSGDIIVGLESLGDFRSSALINGNVVCDRGVINGSLNVIPPNTIIGCFATPPVEPPPPEPFPPEPPPLP